MKYLIEQLLKTALQQLQIVPPASIHVEHTRDKSHGDFASNLALGLAKATHLNPRLLAERIVAQLPDSEWIQKISIAGPGFINFSLTPAAWQAVVKEILIAGFAYGVSRVGDGQSVLIEFVSSNPTGPLHVGHGRSAAYGAAVADILEAAGFHVHREYYVNDGGRQMDILATSVWLRYLQACGEVVVFPSNAYQGDYVLAVAEELRTIYDTRFLHSAAEIFKNVPPDEADGGDKEAHIDALIAQAKILLSTTDYRFIFDKVLNTILDDINEDLGAFGVHYQQWFSERSLLDSNAVDHAIANLAARGHLFEQEGALWFRSTTFGDDKDRVLRRENGQPTYFAVDIAYHLNKLERGFTQLINVLGADHHGYVPRLKAAIEALGHDPKRLTILTVQFAVLYRGQERIQMSTRSGSFVTLRELREEVGADAARFFYVLRKCEQHMDFDLDLAKSQSNDNPVYYIQYAHARICSVLRQLVEKNLSWDKKASLQALHCLTAAHELTLLMELGRYPEIVEAAAVNYEPHLLAHYLRDLANAFHAYYNSHQFLVADGELRNARLALIMATHQVLVNGLKLLGVTAPEVM